MVRLLGALAFLSIALGVTFGSFNATAVHAADCTVDGSIDEVEQEMLRLINEHRAANGKSALVFSDTLNDAAAWKAQNLAEENYFAHDDEPIGRGWVDRIRDCGYTANTWLGENIAAGNEDAQATFNQWLNSPGHNFNMLSDNYNAIGIGRAYVETSTYDWYWATDFGGFADGYTPDQGVGGTLPGDVSCGDGVDSLDAQLVLQQVVGFVDELPCSDVADVSGDGAVNVIDAEIILQFVAGVVSSLPNIA